MQIAYTITEVILIATLVVYFFEDAREKAEKAIYHNQEELNKAVVQLKTEIAEKERIHRQLEDYTAQIEKQKQEVERLNALMVGREITMIEMKKKMKELEDKHESTSLSG